MARTLTPAQLIERSIQKKYRKELWTPCVLAVKRYALIGEGDRVAVCVSGGRASLLLAELTRLLERYGDVPFEARYLALVPARDPDGRRRVEAAASLLDLPVRVFESEAGAPDPMDALCGCARSLGCNKLALGQHLNDVVETTVAAMLHDGTLRGLMPKVRGERFGGMELIRPLYCVRDDDIAAWQRYNDLADLRGVSLFEPSPAREDAGRLVRALRRENPDIESCVFSAIHAVNLDTFPAWRAKGEAHSFLSRYDEK